MDLFDEWCKVCMLLNKKYGIYGSLKCHNSVLLPEHTHWEFLYLSNSKLFVISLWKESWIYNSATCI
jgi:hypothetical protein